MESEVRILIHCPQCRGDMEFLEEAQVVRCEFCGSSLLVAGREGVLRYVIPPTLTDPKRVRALALTYLQHRGLQGLRPSETFLLHLPFWRIQGTAYRWVFGQKRVQADPGSILPPAMDRVKELFVRLLDHTVPGFTGVDVGINTLGVRPQVLHLQPLDKKQWNDRASIFPLEVPLESVRAECERLADAYIGGQELDPEVILHRVVGLRFSVVFLPLWFVECQHTGGHETVLIDAVGGDAIHTTSDATPLVTKLMSEETREPFSFTEIRFLPFRCPNCGWDFPFRPTSLLHLCPTCHRLSGSTGTDWTEIQYDVVLPPDGQRWEEILWVPFWRYRAHLSSSAGALETMADLYRMAPPPRAFAMNREAKRPIHFYVPAMRLLNPKVTQDLASRLTFLQPELPLGAFPETVQPVAAGASLPETDAREMGPIILGAMMPPISRPARNWLKGCQVDLREPRVLFLPFVRRDIFWRELRTNLTFPHGTRSGDLPGGLP